MRVEVVISGVQRESAINVEQSLRVMVGFPDKAKMHPPYTILRGIERRPEFGVEHEALSAIASGLVAGRGLARCLARQL